MAADGFRPRGTSRGHERSAKVKQLFFKRELVRIHCLTAKEQVAAHQFGEFSAELRLCRPLGKDVAQLRHIRQGTLALVAFDPGKQILLLDHVETGEQVLAHDGCYGLGIPALEFAAGQGTLRVDGTQ